MADPSPARLRTLAAEIRYELPRIDRTVQELAEARASMTREAGSPEGVAWRLAVYASAALLETFYTGVEKVLARIAAATSGVPEGPAWHRELLDTMPIDVPGVRPAVLPSSCVSGLSRHLSFRHRFRNLYLFELDAVLLDGLLGATPSVWEETRAALASFASTLEALAEGREG